MAYADYAYYSGTFYGDLIPEESFDKYITRASDYVDRITMNRAATYTADDAVKKASCAVADQFFRIHSARASIASADGELASETVGSHSVTYRSGVETAAALEAQLNSIATGFLANTGLLYRGVPYVYAAHCYTDFG